MFLYVYTNLSGLEKPANSCPCSYTEVNAFELKMHKYLNRDGTSLFAIFAKLYMSYLEKVAITKQILATEEEISKN